MAQNPEMTQAADILCALENGEGNAVHADVVARRLGIHRREVEQIISDLVNDGELISGNSSGYFKIETEAEYLDAMRVLRSRALKVLKRRSALQRAWKRRNGQGKMF